MFHLTKDRVADLPIVTLWKGQRQIGYLWPLGSDQFQKPTDQRAWAVEIPEDETIHLTRGFKTAVAGLLAKVRT